MIFCSDRKKLSCFLALYQKCGKQDNLFPSSTDKILKVRYLVHPKIGKTIQNEKNLFFFKPIKLTFAPYLGNLS